MPPISASVAGDVADDANVSNWEREIVMVSLRSADHHTVPAGISVTANTPSPCRWLGLTSTSSVRQPFI
jgi:hypothetical protein